MKLRREAYLRPLTVLLAFAGVGVALYYLTCDDACRYLSGSVFRVDLKYWGIGYMGGVLVLGLFRRTLWNSLLLSFGVGGEVFLVGFQVVHRVFCPYCLTFAAIVLLLFALHVRPGKKAALLLFAMAGLLTFLLAFSGSATPVYAAGPAHVPTFGKGPVNVRLYTDYACEPCQMLETRAAPLLDALVRKDKIRLTFIDTPIHTETKLYVKYYLYVLRESQTLASAFRIRTLLVEAAQKRVRDPTKLEAFLVARGVSVRPVDVTPTLEVFLGYLSKDRIQFTPTCVVESRAGKKTYTGVNDILAALKRIR
ncbi:MAG: thioredoxin domain-containing protein [Syntrophales bacterium]|nr:thioredoxin domain-containing protein [Syntrophales bacterium]HOG07594.1 thioredoxin domain-containing protein [Syntrophales bacterium]HOS78178.1 thioredoxin domain-containing protein [Syntrophales bacterium]HPB69550.1 thioredoxin domain-containing protein [Syntrophales bacterium]HQN25165.1 thioredoxin domain-containing protein [Syntrophales bacterium]